MASRYLSRESEWMEIRRIFPLTDEQVRMAIELHFNPRRLRSIADRQREVWKRPLGEYIEYLYASRVPRPKEKSFAAGN